MSELSNRIRFLWTRTDFTQKKIAELTGCSETYVTKVLGNYGGHAGWKKKGDKAERPNLGGQIREQYFMNPEYSPHEIARALQITPQEVIEVCKKAGLPFRKHGEK